MDNEEALSIEGELDFADVPIESPRLHISTGQPGTGKTVLDASIAERIHDETGKPIYWVMKPRDASLKELAPDIPEYIHELRDISRLSDTSPNPVQDAVLVGDDWKRIAHARRAMSNINVLIDNLFGLIRHDNLDIVLDDQTASSIDRNNIIRNNYFWIKKPFQDELELGRSHMLDRLQLAWDAKLDETEALLRSEIVSDGMVRVTGIPLPSWWTEEVSVIHRRRPASWYEKAVKLI